MKTVVKEFLLWIFCIALYIVYICWTFIPDSFFYSYGITYYPSKHWALVLPAFSIVMYNYISNYYHYTSKMYTPNIDSINNIKDKHAKYSDDPPSIDENRFIDIPIHIVSKQLYN